MKQKNENLIEDTLSLTVYANLVQLTKKRHSKKIEHKNMHLSRKFEILLKKKFKQNKEITPEEKKEHQTKTLLNFSGIEIPDEFIPLLSKGLEFKISTKKLPIIDMICGIKKAAKSFSSPSMANGFRFECKRIMEKEKNTKLTNITNELCNGLNEWLKQNRLILIENDKGRATCIISQQKVDELINQELSNKERYVELKSDNIEKAKTAINKEIANLRKENIKELKYLTTSAKSYIKDTEQFVNKVKEINLDENEKLVSFDIADMYPSLPKSEVIHEVERRIREDTFKTNLNKEALVRLVKISVEFMTFKIGNKFYNQADGLFIGSPASPCFAEIYIQRIVENSIYSMLHAPRIWLRKVEDTFTVKFTGEEEKDDQIPFLDCLIMRKDDNTVRAKTICTEEADLKEELNYIQKTTQLNEFPNNIVTKTIKETLNKECNGRNQTDRRIQFDCFYPMKKASQNKSPEYARNLM
ncbi:uncharacterized protein LOC130646122 [Hydractinia symbiolongicarpus]|uniref:uncharacterized protein LOC130646122 n=1 Tax=Hydractinia symbiolongicarpus TaxID=13093 RepID=UPI00254CC0DF|nr:uncharacterized protein LOC130646122 [Hydractinia symbiolongicarpus]